MPTRWRNNFLTETLLMAHYVGLDLWYRLVPVVALVIAAALMNAWLFGIICAVTYAALELSLCWLTRPMSIANIKPSLAKAASLWVLGVAVITMFTIAPFFIGSSGSIGATFSGVLWLFGLLFYISNSFGATPIYNWTFLSIVAAGLVSFVAIEAFESRTASSTQDFYATLLLMTVALMSAYITVRRQTVTLTKLAASKDESERQMIRLEYMTNHDFLTQLKTRRAFEDQLEDIQLSNKIVTVFLIDLDGFKPINDSYSHAAGDAVLCAIGRRLVQAIGPSGTVARLGGDEFAVSTTELNEPETARAFAQDLVDQICKPVPYAHRTLDISASIGVCQEKHPATLQHLMMHADQAMYAAKEKIGPSYCYFDAKIFPARASLKDRAELLTALISGEIGPYYQPKVALSTGKIIGMEALARWCHPTRGFLLAGQFLPQIDELGMQSDFLMFTLKRTLGHISELIADGIPPGAVSVNLPEVTLATQTGRDALLDVLRRHPMALPHLTFEVTEDIFIARSAAMIQQSIQQFRRMGVRISLDDFGTGFASFANLRELEFDELKLDTGFVQGLGIDPAAKVLINAFLDIGIGLDVEIIAEGVETSLQRDALIEMGCRNAQGFLFGKAIAFSEIREKLCAAQGITTQKNSAA